MASLSTLIKNQKAVPPDSKQSKPGKPAGSPRLHDHRSVEQSGSEVKSGLADVELGSRTKMFVFVADCKLSQRVKTKLELYSPILTFQESDDVGLYANRDIPYLQEKGFKSIWIYNRSDGNKWIQAQLVHHRDKLCVLGVYSKNKQQRYLSDLDPDVVIRTSNLGKLSVLSVDDLLEELESNSLQNILSESASFLERWFSCSKRVGGDRSKKN
jgi:hypothetical protein